VSRLAAGVCASCVLAFVVVLSGCPGALLDPPAGLTLEALSTTSIRATWDPLRFSASYTLYYGPSSPATQYAVETKETTVLVTGLEPGQGYYFRVTGTNYAGESPFSTEECCYTPSPDWPAPTGLSYTQTDVNEITLSWDPVPDAEWYSIRYARAGRTDYYNDSVYTTSYVCDGLDVGTGYVFGVAVYSVDQSNPWSDIQVAVH
jgi:hypothetical protein